MFIFCVLLTLLTYPIIFVGSFILSLLIVWVFDSGPSTPNLFVSPNTVYKAYRTSFTQWYKGLIIWYKKESNQ